MFFVMLLEECIYTFLDILTHFTKIEAGIEEHHTICVSMICCKLLLPHLVN